MKASLLLAGVAALAFGGAAMAQDAAPAADAPMTQDAAPAPMTAPEADGTPTTATPTEAAPMPDGPATAASNAAAPAPAMAASGSMAPDPARLATAQQTVQSGWSTYDKENKGSLTPLEFGTWVMAAQGQDMTAQVERSRAGRQANLPATKVLNATAAAFAKADANHDNAVSPEELSTFLAS